LVPTRKRARALSDVEIALVTTDSDRSNHSDGGVSDDGSSSDGSASPSSSEQDDGLFLDNFLGELIHDNEGGDLALFGDLVIDGVGEESFNLF
jgi:hypothetical protein